jgi:hypothetical protein
VFGQDPALEHLYGEKAKYMKLEQTNKTETPAVRAYEKELF